MTTLFESEIREQPAVLRRLLERGRERAEAVAEAARRYRPRFVLAAARGTSDNAARYGKYLLGIHNRLVVGLAAPSIITRYGVAPAMEGALVIGISQSGRSPDLIAVVEEGRRQGALTLAITNDEESPLARAAAHCLPIHAGEEKAVAATKTYTAQLFALAMISAAMEGAAPRWEALAALPGWVEEAIGRNASLDSVVAPLRQASRLLVVGRGFNLATAFEVALKIKETSYVMAEPYSSSDLLHGPVAMMDPTLPMLVVAPGGEVLSELEALMERAERQSAPLILLSERAEILARAGLSLGLPEGVPEWLSPLVAVVPGQLLALALALARGLHPDNPRGLSKVTYTL